mmetsp:Transcript_4796/g.11008  ORF Transcript_4796/g.11008 Transcript_4796/m.11008 type:complete len:82 (-) Transcript_4796:155-400(-)
MKGIPMEERCPGWQSGQCNQVLPKPMQDTKELDAMLPREASEAIVPAQGLRQRLALFGLGLSGLALLALSFVPRLRRRCSA